MFYFHLKHCFLKSSLISFSSKMVFMCQADSYATRFNTSVISCEPATCKVETNGKLQKTTGFNIVLEDTILFPEGGGQPDDRGTINNVPVKRVTRKADKAVHFVETEITVGKDVDIVLDWERRFDHMQQHSGQHLITAIVDNEFGFKTTSWDLGKSVSFIELDTPEMKECQIKHIERLINKAIRDSTPVVIHVTQANSPLLDTVRTRGLPDDHVGDVRIVEMKGIEANMCCGTHVKNLSDLQCIKLLSADKGKKGKTNLLFLAGERVLTYADKCFATERQLTKHLKCGADQHVSAVERTISQMKVAQKNSINLLRDVALLEAHKINESYLQKHEKFVAIHRKEGNVEFMNIIANEVDDSVCLFLTTGDEKGEGMFLLKGPGTFIEKCSQSVSELIVGKGMTKANRMQGKAVKLQRKEQAISIIKEYLST